MRRWLPRAGGGAAGDLQAVLRSFTRTVGVALLLLSWTRPAAAAPTQDGMSDAAYTRYRIGAALYREQKFAEAAREFEVALGLSPQSTKLAYNLARSRESAGELKGAVQAYERYLELAPAADDRADVEQVIATLRQMIIRHAAPEPAEPSPASDLAPAVAPAPPPTPAPAAAVEPGPAPDPSAPPDAAGAPWLWIAAGVAGVGALGALIAALSARSDAQGMEDDYDPAARDAGARKKEYDARNDDYALWSSLSLVATGLAAAAGVAAVVLTPDEAAVTLRWSW